jgi:hypothetical protein
MFKKLSWLLIATLVLSTAMLIAAQPAAAGSGSNQIMFSIKGGTIDWVVIDGTNQKDQPARYIWADAYYNNWETGATVVLTTDWWWKDYVDIQFSSKEIGYGHCVIDNLEVDTNSDYTPVQYDPATNTCSGDAGSASDLQFLDAFKRGKVCNQSSRLTLQRKVRHGILLQQLASWKETGDHAHRNCSRNVSGT